ncbi:MAG: TIGR00730 family Rossman fold protein [Planctomycetaceae bacterium]|nr:TIGR00730 family Rossman fold protein [Planctomycetaceae bacterium]
MTVDSANVPIRRVCVFCGSNRGNDARYAADAAELGQALVRRGWELIYGGGQVGLMEVLADAVLAQGGTVTGVIPEMLATKELLHTGATRMHVVASMHARKALMAELADAFVALPGGFGTFEETLEMITWGQLGIHRKPLGLLDTLGFYQPLVRFIEQAVSAGFIRPEQRELLVMADSPDMLLDRLTRQQLPSVRKWIQPAES